MVLTGTKPKPAQKPDNEILSEASTESKIHRFTYVFARSRHWTPPAGQTTSLRDGHLNTGDPVTVSVEPNMLALVKGYILELGAAEVVLGVDRALDVAALRARTGLAPSADLVFRIDKDEMFGGMARMRGNLAHLFYADGDAKRRSLVVDLRAPLFSAPTPAFDARAKRHAHFNASQKDAMARVLAAGRQAGVAVGIFAGDTAAARQYREAGYRMITVSADVSWLLRATRQALQEVRS